MRATDIIRDEHRSFAAVLHGLGYLATELKAGRMEPDFTLLDAMLRYIEGFPERLHHPKEDEFLFPAVRRCAPETIAAIEELTRQHDEGRRLITELRDALERFRGLAGVAPFAEAVERYADFHWKHMRIEEDQILPAADAKLAPKDALVVDAAFAANEDPISGVSEAREFRDLFRRIVNLAPAPIGVGPVRRQQGNR